MNNIINKFYFYKKMSYVSPYKSSFVSTRPYDRYPYDRYPYDRYPFYGSPRR